MHVYGVSLTILLNRSEQKSDICGKIGKCFEDGDDSIFHEIKKGKNLLVQLFMMRNHEFCLT